MGEGMWLSRSRARRLLDMVELGVDRYRAIKEFRSAAAAVQIGNKVSTGSAALVHLGWSGAKCQRQGYGGVRVVEWRLVRASIHQ